MGLLDWLFGIGRPPLHTGPSPASPAAPPHAVVLFIHLPAACDLHELHERYEPLQRDLIEALRRHHAGVHTSTHWNENFCAIEFHGPDADSLWDALAQELQKHPFPKGSHAIRRYGPEGSRFDRIDLAWDG